MYARLCQRLCEESPNAEKAEPCIFRLLLINSCKAQFESRAIDKSDKRKSLGNIKFIGELCKLKLIGNGTLHKCVQNLLKKDKDPDERAEDLECLCQIMRTCGQILDEEKAQVWMNQYFEKMTQLSENATLPIRIRFMLKDIIELRRDKWIPRRATNNEGPIPITQICDDSGPLPHRERLPQQELFPRSPKSRPAFDGVLSSSLFAQPGKFPTYNSNGFSSGFRDRGSQRQSHHQSQNTPHFYQQNRYNNQHNNNNSNNVSSIKDLPPRFKRITEQSSASLEEVSLRPPAQSMVFKQPNTKPPSQLFSGPKPPSLLTDSLSSSGGLKQPPPIQTTKEVPILIKQANTDRTKPSKKDKATTKEETLKKVSGIADDILSGGNIADAVTNFIQLKVPDRLVSECLHSLLSKTYDKTDTDRETVMSFITSLKKEKAVTPTQFGEAYRILVKTIPDLEATVPNIVNFVSEFSANAIKNGLLTIAQIGELTEDGANFPLIFNSLQELNKTMEKQELTDLFNESKVSLMNILPEGERTKERLCTVLEERGIVFLESLLVLEAELWSALEKEPSSDSLYRCAMESVNPSHHNSAPFVTALLTVCLRYITQEVTQGKDIPSGGASIKEKEKALLENFQTVLRGFLHGNVNLQITAVYALQVFCYSLDFPKGMLLRWFVNLYELEIIEEDAFLKWREDLSEMYPGKGKALFQVNQWLTWLDEAESEEEEEDEEEK